MSRDAAGDRFALAIKEGRALLPTWLAGLGAVVAAGALEVTLGRLLAVFGAYAVTALALGAQSIGHEYASGTLPWLLSQPTPRSRVLVVKVAVLAGMLATVSAAAWWMRPTAQALPAYLADPLLFLLPLFVGLFLAPWLTMVGRGALPGVVFSASLPPSLWLLGQVAGLTWYGVLTGPEIDRVGLAAVRWGTLTLCAVAAVAGWRMFLRLEATEGPRGGFVGPASMGRRARARARHPLLQLLGKELRLQHLTFVLAALYAGGLAVLRLVGASAPELRGIAGVLTIAYLPLLALVIGSLASAEERQLGTLESQLVLPMPAWMQWTVKAGTALGLALTLGVGFPLALYALFSPPDLAGQIRAIALPFVALLVTSGSLYVSSLSTSGVRAVVFSLPVGLLSAAAVQWIARGVALTLGPSRVSPPWSGATALVLLPLGVSVLALWFAFTNHRALDRPMGRTFRQGLWMAALVTVSFVLARLTD